MLYQQIIASIFFDKKTQSNFLVESYIQKDNFQNKPTPIL